jgi:5-bromo-4-chloroindolyl phosphate hydrolysis protein
MRPITIGTALILVLNVKCTSVTVYTCDSKYATKYHYKENCRGLSGCHYRIVKTTLEEAKKENKKLCEWERKNKKNSDSEVIYP